MPSPDGEVIGVTVAAYITGTGQRLMHIHDGEECEGRPCVIHNPSDHAMRSWPTHWREDRGIMERICEHGVGHPDPDDSAFRKSDGPETWNFTGGNAHACDGCCS